MAFETLFYLNQKTVGFAERTCPSRGFNIGMNNGESAGQTIFHCHIHLIPRRSKDVDNSRGGVRHIIPIKGVIDFKILIMKEKLDKRLLKALEYGKVHYFRDWSNCIVPKICAGVYTIWKDEQLIYVGMSGRSLNAEIIQEHKNTGTKTKGLFNRLKSHASGRRSGDQFCVYIADRLVLPTLTREQIEAIASKELNFDNLIRDYIHTHLFYRYVETENDKQAFQLENAVKGGALKAGKPFLNPSN